MGQEGVVGSHGVDLPQIARSKSATFAQLSHQPLRTQKTKDLPPHNNNLRAQLLHTHNSSFSTTTSRMSLAELAGDDVHQRSQALANHTAFAFNDTVDTRHAFHPFGMLSYEAQIHNHYPSPLSKCMSTSRSRAASGWVPSRRLISRAEAATFVIYEDETAQPLEPGDATGNPDARPYTPESAAWASDLASSSPSTPSTDEDEAMEMVEETEDSVVNDENQNIFSRIASPSSELPRTSEEPATSASQIPSRWPPLLALTPPTTPGSETLSIKKRRKYSHSTLIDTPRTTSPKKQRDLLSDTFRQFLNTPGHMLVPTIATSASRRASQMSKRKREESSFTPEKTLPSAFMTPGKDFDICEGVKIRLEPMKSLVIRRTRSLTMMHETAENDCDASPITPTKIRGSVIAGRRRSAWM